MSKGRPSPGNKVCYPRSSAARKIDEWPLIALYARAAAFSGFTVTEAQRQGWSKKHHAWEAVTKFFTGRS